MVVIVRLILFIVLPIMLFVGKNIILEKEKKENKQKLWPIYFSSLFAEITSLLGIYIIQGDLIGWSFSDFIVFCGVCLILIIENVILLIVGIVCFIKQKKNVKKRKIKVENYTLVKIILTFLCINSLVLFISYTPKMFKTKMEKYIEDYVIEYMTKKYGEGDFKILNIAKEYSGGLMGVSEEFSGYYIKIKTSYIKKPVGMFIDGITKETIEVSYDSLLLDYYEEINKDYGDIVFFQDYIMLKKGEVIEAKYKNDFGLNVDFDIDCYYEVPDNYGRIPSIDELVGLCSIKRKYMKVRIVDEVEFEDKLDYLKKLAKYSMNYFNIDEEIIFSYSFTNGNEGSIRINNKTITIKLNDVETVYLKEEIQNYIN